MIWLKLYVLVLVKYMNLHVYIIYIILLIKQSYTFIQLYIFLYHIIVSNHVISDRFFRLNWLYLYHICCGCSRTVEGMHWLTNPNLRSKDYGSPNARRRVYIVGARVDVCNEANFQMMVNYIKIACPEVHQRVSLLDCPLPMAVWQCAVVVSMFGHVEKHQRLC